jgi:hypothetical protein
MLAAVGCGGSDEGPKRDAGPDGAPAPAAQLGLTGTGTFGGVEIGSTSSMPATFTVTNTGGATTGTVMATVTGDFNIQTNNCNNKALAAAETCTILVRFAPTMAGTRTGQLSVTATPGGTQTAALTGTGNRAAALSINPETNPFGNIVVGQNSSAVPFTVRNGGDVALSSLAVTASTDFEITDNKCGAMLAGGATCVVQVRFSPKSDGEKRGTLTASAGGNTATAALTGNAQRPAQLVSGSNNISFSAANGATSGAVSVTIANAGDVATGAPMVSLDGTNKGEFEISANTCVAPIAALRDCRVDVVFKPTSVANGKVAVLKVTATPGGTLNIDLTGNGLAPGSISVNPTAGSYTPAVVGTSSSAQTFTVTNNGQAATGTLTTTIIGTDPTHFSLVSDTCNNKTVAAGGTCTISAQFNPTSAGAKTAILSISGTPGGTTTAQLSGTAITAATLSADRSSHPFGSIGLNASSGDVTFTFTNNGGVNATGVTTALQGTDASQFEIAGSTCSGTVNAGAACTVTVRFKPTAPTGAKTASLVVSTTGSSASITLSGSGINPTTYTVEAQAGSTFGDTVVGAQSAELTWKVTNTSAQNSGPLTLATSNETEFQIVREPAKTNCSELAPNATCIITVKFVPATAGPKQANLTVSGGGGTGSATMSAVGFNPIDIQPTAWSFPDPVSVNLQSSEQPFTVNVRVAGAATATLGAGAVDFTISDPIDCLDDPTSSNIDWRVCTIGVTFTPKGRGTKTDELTVTAGTASDTAGLSGLGVGPLVLSPLSPAPKTGIIGVTPPQTQIFQVTNNDATSPVNNLVTEITAGDGFLVTANECVGINLAPMGPPCKITVEFTTKAPAGERSFTLRVRGTVGAGATPEQTELATLTGTSTNAAPSTTSLDGNGQFGAVVMTGAGVSTFTVTNAAGAAQSGAISAPQISGANTDDFSVINNTCVGGLSTLAGGASCTFQVRFSPTGNYAAGERNATVSVAIAGDETKTKPLQGTATQPLSIAVVAPATSGAFNEAASGVSDGNAQTISFVVTNEGTVDLPVVATIEPTGVAATDDVDDFEVVSGCDGINIGKDNGTCTVTVRFVPNDLGASTARIQVASGGNIKAAADISGTGITDATLTFVDVTGGSPSLQFGTVATGTAESGSIKLTVRNAGQAPTSNLVFSPPNGFEVATGTTCSTAAPLNGGLTCDLVLKWNPTANGAAPASTVAVTALNRAGGAITTQVVALLGAGAAPESFLAVETPVGFDALFAGEASNKTLTFRNNTAVPVSVTAVAGSGVFTAVAGGTRPCSGAAIPAGDTCQVVVTFGPGSSESAGLKQGTVTVTTDAGTATAGVYGRVRNNAILEFTGTQGNANFGDVVNGTQSDVRTWTVKNVGERSSDVVDVTLSGAGYVLGGDCDGKTLTPDQTCTVTVQFSPSNAAAIDGIADTGSFTIAAAATGVTVPGIVNLTANVVRTSEITLLIGGNALTTSDFSDVPVSGQSSVNVVVQNVQFGKATGPLVISRTSEDEFLVSGCDGVILDAATPTCTMTVTFKPGSKDTGKTSILTVEENGGSSDQVTFTGNGIAGFQVSPASKTFAPMEEQQFTFSLVSGSTNSGTISPTISDPSFQYTADNCTGKALTTAAPSCTVTVKFVSTGAKTGTLSAQGTGTGNAVSATLTGS